MLRPPFANTIFILGLLSAPGLLIGAGMAILESESESIFGAIAFAFLGASVLVPLGGYLCRGDDEDLRKGRWTLLVGIMLAWLACSFFQYRLLKEYETGVGFTIFLLVLVMPPTVACTLAWAVRHRPPRRLMMPHCPSCGHAVGNGDQFCTGCGDRLFA